MTESFDPYYTWLGIPPDEQPPNFYRLLGVRLFEDNADVIANAADARMGFVRSFQAGPRAGLSQRLLNELSAAKVSLLDANRKANYDRQLAQRLGIATAPVVAPIATPVAVPVALQPVPIAPAAIPLHPAAPPVSPPVMAPPVPTGVGVSPGRISELAPNRAPTTAEPAVHRRHRKSSNSTAFTLALLGVGCAVVAVIAIVVYSMSGDADPTTAPGASGKGSPSVVGTGTNGTTASNASAGSKSTGNSTSSAGTPPGGTPSTAGNPTSPSKSGADNKTVKSSGAPTKSPPIKPLPVTPAKSEKSRASVAPPPATAWSVPPQVWRYEINAGQGAVPAAFFQTHGGWQEVARDGYYAFTRDQSSDASQEFVELSRTNPQVRVRLFADHSEMSIGAGPFKRQYDGGWSESAYPFAAAVRIAGQGGVRIAVPDNSLAPTRPFRVELWFRPIADPPAGDYVLVSAGPTVLLWQVQADGRHRLGIQRAPGREFWIRLTEMRADWNHLGYAFDGTDVYLTFNGQGARTTKKSIFRDEAGATEIVLGGSTSSAKTPTIDVGGFRIDTAGAEWKDPKLSPNAVRHRLLLPDDWKPTEATVTQLAFAADNQQVRDLAPQPCAVQLEDAAVIDVLTQEPFLSAGDSHSDNATAATGKPNDPSSTEDSDNPPRTLGDLLNSKRNTNMAGGTAAGNSSSAPETGQRLPVPEQALLTVALDRVRSMYRGQFEGAKKATEKVALATKLAEQSRKATDAAERYVLYDQTRSLLADGAQLSDAMSWIDELAGAFEVDGIALKVAAAQRVNEVLTGTSNAAPILRLQMVEAAIAASSAALELERYDEADKLAQLALQQTKSRFLNDVELRRSAKDHADAVARVRKEWQDALRAEQKLETTPDDNLARLIVGRYRCFRCNQWQVGLPHLAKSAHAKLSEAAQLDLELSGRAADMPTTATDLSKAGAAWERASEGAAAEERRDCLERARHWYQLALTAASEPAELNSIRHHLDQIKSAVPTAHPRRTVTMSDGTRVDVHPGLIGRILVAGRDSGALVTYQLGKPIDYANVRRAIADVRWSGNVQIELVGYLLAPENRPFSLELEERSNPETKQLLFLDMKQIAVIDAQRQRERKSLALAPVRHSLVWRLDSLESSSHPTLSFPAPRTTEAPTVYYTKQMLDALRLSPSIKGESRREFELHTE